MATNLKATCPSCNNNIEYPSDYAGRQINCPHCGDAVTLPAIGAGAQTTTAPAPSSKAKDPAKYNKNDFYCTQCGHVGPRKTSYRGSLLVLIILLLLCLLPGIIYGVWWLTTWRKVCASCKSPDVIPVTSPEAQKRLNG